MKRQIVLLGLCFFLSAVKLQAANDSLYWYTYFADSVTGVEGFTKIRTDSSGHLKMIYRNGHKISFIDFDGKSFKRTTADSGIICCNAKVAMDLDRNGNAHILREDEEYKAIYYVEQDGSKWKRTFVDSIDAQGNLDFYQLGIAVDQNNTSHIFYPKEKGTSTHMHYRTIDQKGVISDATTLCPDCGYNGKWANISLDSLGKPWISFFINNKNDLGLLHLDGTSWKQDTVDTADHDWEPNSGYYSDIKNDTNGNALITYQNYTERKIIFASGNKKLGWKFEPIDSIYEKTTYSSQSALTSDGKGTIYLAYTVMKKLNGYDPAECQLMFATKKNGVWKKLTLDTNGIVGEYASITTTSEGLPAIAYYDRTKGALKLMVAKFVAPADTNKNGIPDYQETGIKSKSTRMGLTKPNQKGNLFDSLGRRINRKAGKLFGKFNFSKP